MTTPGRVRETPRAERRWRTWREAPPKAPRVQVHAHRGGAALAPENTLYAFEKACELGAHWVELDVQLSRDGVLVVVHDDDLRRVGGVDRRVEDLTVADLRTIDVGSFFDARYADARVPTLAEVIDLCRGQVRLNIEIKDDRFPGHAVADALGRMLAGSPLLPDVIVSSFNPLALRRFSRWCRPPLGLCYPMDGGRGVLGRARDHLFAEPWTAPLFAAYALHPDHTVVREETIRKAHLRGLAVNAWTVNDEARMRELCGWRINGLITDRPDLALAVVGSLGR